MSVTHYIGFDVHKKSVQYCVKTAAGLIVEEGKLRAERRVLAAWAGQRAEPWEGAMEVTLFSGWIYDTLQPYAAELNMAHPLMMKAIGASKKKSDRIDARKIADMVRCHWLPVCYVAPAGKRLESAKRDFQFPGVHLRSRSDDLLMIQQPILAAKGTAQRSACSRCAEGSVSRPAGRPHSIFGDSEPLFPPPGETSVSP